LDGRDPLELTRQLCDGGADLIQLRAKERPIDQIRRWGESMRKVTDQAGVGLVINDHPQVAQEIGAWGCHLGQEDFFDAGFEQAAEVAPPPLRLGLSSHAPAQAQRALLAGPAYLAIGPVFATPTKPGRPAVTLEYVQWAAANLAIPWVAIGGINLNNLESILSAGARRVAVVSAILRAPDVLRACQAFKEQLRSAPQKNNIQA
jgi:thiamine-phosphate pyrophosphorylase